MKNNLFKNALILAFVLISASAFAQVGTDKVLYENTTATAAGAYTVDQLKTYITTGLGSGTVTSVSVVTANGFTGSVTNASTTPAITLSTNVTGLLKGSGAGLTAAAGSDVITAFGSQTANFVFAAPNGSNGPPSFRALTAADVTGTLFNTVLGTTGTDVTFGTSTVSSGGTVTLNIPDASGTARGVITTGTQSLSGAKTFSTSLISSGAAVFNGSTTLNNQIIITPGAIINATGNLAVAAGIYTASVTAAPAVLTLPTSVTTGTVIEIPILSTNTQTISFTSATETINGNAIGVNYLVNTSAVNTTIKVLKVTSGGWRIGLLAY